MMSAVQTKLNGVFRSSLSLRSDPARRQVERRLVVVLRRPLVQAGERRLERDVLAVLLVALDRAERQPQRERGVGVGVRPLDGELGLGEVGVGRALRLVDLRFHPLAHGPRLGVDQLGQRDHRVLGLVQRLFAAFVELLAHVHVLSFVPRDQLEGPVVRRLAGQHLLHQRVVVAQLLGQEGQAVGQLDDLVVVVDRLVGEQVELQLVQGAVAVLAQPLGVLLGSSSAARTRVRAMLKQLRLEARRSPRLPAWCSGGRSRPASSRPGRCGPRRRPRP